MTNVDINSYNLKRANSCDYSSSQRLNSLHSCTKSNPTNDEKQENEVMGLKQRHNSVSSFVNLKTRRKLSIAGKELLKQAFSLPLHCGVTSSTKSVNLNSLQKLSKKKFKKRNLKNNPYGAFSDSDSSSESSSEEDISESEQIFVNHQMFHEIKDNEEGWNVVKEERKEKVQNEYKRPKYPWEYSDDENEDIGSVLDLANVQKDALDGRSFGRFKKSNQFKVAQQRNFSIKKRNRQRGS